jgi:chaperonin GroES
MSTTAMNFATARVLNNYAVVRPLAPERFTSGGLEIPTTNQDAPLRGIVIAVGPGERHAITGEPIPMLVRVGDLVTFTRYGGIDLDDAQNLKLMRETELGVAWGPEQFELVTHEDPTTWHLAGAYCETCLAATVDAEKAAFTVLREQYGGHLGVRMNVREAEESQS